MEGGAIVTVKVPQKHRAVGDEVLAILCGQAATIDPAVACSAQNHS